MFTNTIQCYFSLEKSLGTAVFQKNGSGAIYYCNILKYTCLYRSYVLNNSKQY